MNRKTRLNYIYNNLLITIYNYNRKTFPISIFNYKDITILIDNLFFYDSTFLLPSDFPKLPYLFFYHLLNKTLNTNIQYILMLGFLNVHLISQTSFFMSIHLQSLT
ncbi:hypothetical protein [Bacillus cereus group sp. FL121]|uniref:hypothetical protein n=1 Tax=Bacillus cereus group sp. FL121 TaxID=3040255 RepID=UPI0013D4CEE2